MLVMPQTFAEDYIGACRIDINVKTSVIMLSKNHGSTLLQVLTPDLQGAASSIQMSIARCAGSLRARKCS